MEQDQKNRVPTEPPAPLLEVQGLHVSYAIRGGPAAEALCGISFSVRRGEVLGVLGESGSGKSTIAAALSGTLHPNGTIRKGVAKFAGNDLLQAGEEELRKIRGGSIGAVFQEPSLALHPCLRVGKQVADVLQAHQELERTALREKTLQVLAGVFPKEPERFAEAYPHQLSGGQRTRVLIAQATACGPALVIADEPTSSLDPTTRQEILALFRSLRAEIGLSMLWITHDPFLLTGLADRVLVLYAGRIVETGMCDEVLRAPRHPYTRDLLRCVPSFSEAQMHPKTKLPVIREDSRNARGSAARCVFEGRCEDRMEICSQREPVGIAVNDGGTVACFKYSGE